MTSSATSPTFAIVAGGGTGGHVVPALAIGQALVERGHPPATIQFVGSARGIERRMVPEAGFPLILLPGRGIVRRASLANVKAAAGLVVATWRAAALVRRLWPAVVVSVGGYASVPCVLAAVLWRRPLVVAEQNAVPGAANRLAGRFARAAAVSFPETPLPRATVTGNPVRSAVLTVDRSPSARAAARRRLGLPVDAAVVAVMTGSLGAARVNRAVVALVERWAGRPELGSIAVRHVIGDRDWDELAGTGPSGRERDGGPSGRERDAGPSGRERDAGPSGRERDAGPSGRERDGGPSGRERDGGPSGRGGVTYQQVRFEDHVELLYAAADVLVGRAGASTVAELAVVGLGSVLVPLPGAPGDHQSHNARRMEAAGAAVVVPDSSCDADHLDAVLRPLLAEPSRLEAMGCAARRVGRPGAAAAVASLAVRASGRERDAGPSGRERDAGPSGRERDAGPSGRERDAGPSGRERDAGPSGRERDAGPSGRERDAGPSGRERDAGPSGRERDAGRSGRERND